MILVTGGAFQGKLEAAKQIYRRDIWEKNSEKTAGIPLVAEGETGLLEEMKRADIINHFHLWIRILLEQKKDPWELAEKLAAENPKVILVFSQLGCGVVPMDAFDRSYRETVGRISCRLAKEAEQVYLVNCGLVKTLKKR